MSTWMTLEVGDWGESVITESPHRDTSPPFAGKS